MNKSRKFNQFKRNTKHWGGGKPEADASRFVDSEVEAVAANLSGRTLKGPLCVRYFRGYYPRSKLTCQSHLLLPDSVKARVSLTSFYSRQLSSALLDAGALLRSQGPVPRPHVLFPLQQKRCRSVGSDICSLASLLPRPPAPPLCLLCWNVLLVPMPPPGAWLGGLCRHLPHLWRLPKSWTWGQWKH